MISKKRLLNRFIKYVKTSSPSKKEGKFLKLIKKELTSMGIKSSEDTAAYHLDGEAGNLYASIKGNVAAAPRILINAHLDTVKPGVGIKPRVKNGVIRSDGTTILGADNKAGVVVMIEVMKAIREGKYRHGPIDIIFTVAEEIGLCGSKYLNRRKLKADFGYVVDGGDVDEMIGKAPSQDSLEIRIIGKAAHAGVHPEDGINAIKVASEAISRMKVGRIDKETTANIGVIKGGIAGNIVPDEVFLKGEVRSHDRRKLKRQVLHMQKMLQKACKKYKAKLRFKATAAYRSFEIERSSRVMKVAVSSAKKVGLKPKVKATGGGSDANIFSAFGIPCLIIGAGADNVHTNKENVAVSDMYKGAQFLLEIIQEAARG
ncbi:M20/M25/M40 family metallo-hydrolase [Candidatus Margulisiibacteriota bacterium]